MIFKKEKMPKKEGFVNNKMNFLMLILLEAVLLSFIFFFQFIPMVGGEIGTNATVITQLEVGNVFPEVLNVSIDNDASTITLIPNATKTVVCQALIVDWNNESDFSNVYAEFFNSSWGGGDDNNEHYTNSSCNITLNFGSWHGVSDDNYTALANCTFSTWYYANSGKWNCSVVVNDTYNWKATGSDDITISDLLAVGLPDSINYGIVNATYVSDEQTANVTNFGNVEIDVALSGYAVSVGDNQAMNCTLGSIKNISINYEKYNLNESIPGVLSLTEFEGNYTNLTKSPLTKEYNLNSRQDDITNEAINETYWRIYVPLGVAGTCQGNIVFGAIKSS